MKVFKALLFALLLAPVLALAQGYAGGTAGQGSVSGFDGNSTTTRVFGGYQFNRYLAVEGGYASLGSANAATEGLTVSAKASALDVGAVGMLPLGHGVTLFAKGGGYRAQTSVGSNFGFSESVTNFGLTYGAGATYTITPKVALRGEWQRYGGVGGGQVGKSDVDVLAVGVSFSF
jgi:opacity protein-like surface antigen